MTSPVNISIIRDTCIMCIFMCIHRCKRLSTLNVDFQEMLRLYWNLFLVQKKVRQSVKQLMKWDWSNIDITDHALTLLEVTSNAEAFDVMRGQPL